MRLCKRFHFKLSLFCASGKTNSSRDILAKKCRLESGVILDDITVKNAQPNFICTKPSKHTSHEQKRANHTTVKTFNTLFDGKGS